MDAGKKGRNIRSLLRSMEESCIRDPEGLLEIGPMIDTAQDVMNVTLYVHAMNRKLRNPGALPQSYFATLLGITEQAVAKREKLGAAVMEDRERLSGAVKFVDAKRDRDRRDREVAAARERLAGLSGGAEAATGTAG